jgi:hypothetical protein
LAARYGGWYLLSKYVGYQYLTTFIVEYRSDESGDYIWVVTAWKSIKQEQKSYDQQIRIG